MNKRPFRFYDNRQKYLAFVTTCNEKWKIAERATQDLANIEPKPPALHVFDAGMGDGSVMSNMMRAIHQRFPTVPLLVVGKEISLEDMRLCLEKLPDRFIEHPATVVAMTNLYYAEAPWLKPRKLPHTLNWVEMELQGDTSQAYGEQLRSLEHELVDGWRVTSSKSGNPRYVQPSVLVLYRSDHKFLLDSTLSHIRNNRADYDVVLASQPWRARMSADFKVKHVLAPLTRSLRPGGRLQVTQSYGNDPGMELIREIWPDENPFQVNRYALVDELKNQLGDSIDEYRVSRMEDRKSIFRYKMHTLPEEISHSIGTSTLFAAWNAAIYVSQIEDERLESVVASGNYLDATARILHRHNGLWFNDESFVIVRKTF